MPQIKWVSLIKQMVFNTKEIKHLLFQDPTKVFNIPSHGILLVVLDFMYKSSSEIWLNWRSPVVLLKEETGLSKWLSMRCIFIMLVLTELWNSVI